MGISYKLVLSLMIISLVLLAMDASVFIVRAQHSGAATSGNALGQGATSGAATSGSATGPGATSGAAKSGNATSEHENSTSNTPSKAGSSPF
jgi:hypothetical protein